MNSEMMPLYWRIETTEQKGVEGVSLLMPGNQLGEDASEYPTDVFVRSNRVSKGKPVDLRWTDEDSDLFLNLLDRVVELEDDSEITLDLNDGIVQGIVQLVALARFKSPWPSDDLVGEDINTIRDEVEIGDLVAISTQHGYCQAIIIGLDSIDATCVLLEPIQTESNRVLMPAQSLLVVNRLSVLSSVFADTDPGQGQVRH
jgi:hypothetical protein